MHNRWLSYFPILRSRLRYFTFVDISVLRILNSLMVDYGFIFTKIYFITKSRILQNFNTMKIWSHMVFRLHIMPQITPLVIYSLGGGHTHTHTHKHTDFPNKSNFKKQPHHVMLILFDLLVNKDRSLLHAFDLG